MEPASKLQDKKALREKNRVTARDFIKMKRGQAKEQKNSSESFERVRGFILEGSSEKLEEFMLQNKPEFILTFLFSQDQMKETPMMQIIKSNFCCQFLQILNRWSSKNNDLMMKQIKMEDNQLKANYYRGKFQALNKSVMEDFNKKISSGNDIKDVILVLGEKGGIFYHLCKNFLTLELIISTITSVKTKNNLLTEYYVPLLNQTDLRELQELVSNVSGYQSLLLRQKLWSNANSTILKDITLDNLDLLTLNELKYNIWHELANKSPSEFFKACDFVINLQGKEELQRQYWDMLLEIDSSGQSVMDKCLKQWKFDQLLTVIERSKNIQNLMISTNCLNNLFYNRKLNQQQREKLIVECLQGDISTKGYIKIIAKNRQKQLKRKRKQNASRIVLEIKPIKYTFSICYDKNQLKKQKDNTGGYPLCTYLKNYKKTANLKIVQLLYLEFFNRKEIKKKFILLLKIVEDKKISICKQSEKRDEIQNLFDYYQPLWKVMTSLVHGDVLEYLLSKTYINCYEVKFTKALNTIDVELGGKQFIAYYIQNNPFLGQDAINRQILDSIIKCKPSEKVVGRFNFVLELTRTLNNNQLFHNSQDYLVVSIRQYLRSQLMQLPFCEFMQFMHVDNWQKIVNLLDVIAEPISKSKLSILSQKDLIEKCDAQMLKDYYYKTVNEFPKEKLHLKLFYRKILTLLNIIIQQEDIFIESYKLFQTKDFLKLQQLYCLNFSPDKKNKQFFDGLKDRLDSMTGIELANKSEKFKFYCFRLKPTEKYLTYKFRKLLQLGIDPYFSKYSNQSIEFNDQNKEWNLIMKKMLVENKTFIEALITEPTVKFQSFKDIFQVCLSDTLCKEQWIKWSLVRKIQHNYKDFQHNQSHIFFIKNSYKASYNFQLIVDIIEFATKHGFTISEFIKTLQYYFSIVIRQSSLQLSNLKNLMLSSKAEQKAVVESKLNKTKEQISIFIDKWLTYMKQVIKQNQSQQFLMQQFLINLVRCVMHKGDDFITQAIFKHVEFDSICDSRLIVDKLRYTRSDDSLLSAYLIGLTQKAMATWITTIILATQSSPQKAALISKKMPFDLQINILKNLFEKIEKIQPAKKAKKYEKSKLMIFTKIMLSGVVPDNFPQLLEYIKKLETSDKIKEIFINRLLRSSDDEKLMTLTLILLQLPKKLYFCFKSDDKYKTFHIKNIYTKCDDKIFDAYLQNLKKYHHLCENIGSHLKNTIKCLVEAFSWARLEKLLQVRSINHITAPLSFNILCQTLREDYNQQRKQMQGIRLINQLFDFYQKSNLEFNQDLFVAAFLFDPQKAFKAFKPTTLSIYGFRKCISAHYQSSPLFITHGVTLNLDYLPDNICHKLQFSWLPLSIPHTAFTLSTYSWALDLLKIEISILNSVDSKWIYRQKLRALSTCIQVLALKKQILGDVISDKDICQALLRFNQTKSLSPFEKYVPQLKNLAKQEIFRKISKKSVCMNLTVLNPMLLQQLIVNKIVSSAEPKTLYSCLLRVIDTTNMHLIDLFIKTNNITLSYDYLEQVKSFFNFHFWDYLLQKYNQDFLVAFITKYKLFELYSTEEYSQKLLNTICRLRSNRLLEFTIKYFEAKCGKKILFAAETAQNKPSISDKGVFYLPIKVSMATNFYEAYFLIRGSNNECPKFNVSARFISYVNSKPWSYLPDFQRRIQLNNTFIENLRQAQEMDFRFKVLIPSIFELEVPKIYLSEPEEENLRQNKHNNHLCNFISNIAKNSLQLDPTSGLFQKLCFMVFMKNETKIPEEQLSKKYPSEMKLINKIRKFVDNLQANATLNDLFECFPEFKSQLLIYNPAAFMQNPQYMNQIKGEGDKKLDFSQYLKGIQINFLEFKAKYPQILHSYIEEYFFKSSVPFGSPQASHHLTRQALVLILLEISHHQRKEQECSIYNLCKWNVPFSRDNQEQQETENDPRELRTCEEVLYDVSRCLNLRAKGVTSFDLMVWNKIIKEIEEIQTYWKDFDKGTLKEFSFPKEDVNKIIKRYAEIVSKKIKPHKINNLKEILCEMYDKHIEKCGKKSVFIEISLIMNLFLIQNDFKILIDKIKEDQSGKNLKQVNLTLVKQAETTTIAESPEKITIQLPYRIQEHESKHILLIMIDTNQQNLMENICLQLILANIRQHPEIDQLNQYCAKAERHAFVKDYKFQYDVQSFAKTKHRSMIYQALHFNHSDQSRYVVRQIMSYMEKIEERLTGIKNIKIYTSSDIYGPINFSQEKDHDKIMDCLGFYEPIGIPKTDSIKVIHDEKRQQKEPASVVNSITLQQFKSYCNYYIAVSKDQDFNGNLQIADCVYPTGGDSFLYRFGVWTISEIYCLILSFCRDLSIKVDKVLDARASFKSIIDYFEHYIALGFEQTFRSALSNLLYQKRFSQLVESIIMMITEDVGNIMKIVKGIIFKWTINKKDRKKKAKVVIFQFANAVSVEYEVKDHLLYIIINLEMQKGLNKSTEQSDDFNLLIDRKEFLVSVFTSAQFLADYFIMRNQLNNECLKISTSITKKLNTTVNFHIEYSNLYAYVEKMRNQCSIKQIESFLIRLKQYLQNSMDKVINLYLNSQELANKHQVFILNKCEAINKNVPSQVIDSEKELVYDSLETDPQSGLKEVISLMNQIGYEYGIKNTFLIQIYKSYYTTMVGEGMTFVVGYKSSKKKSQVIQITKSENINLINIVELDYIMLVSNKIPTNDELNQNKIIRIFITDSNKYIYQLSNNIKNYFLSLPEQNQERHISSFAPMIPSNVMLAFSTDEKRYPDTKDTKTFYIDLNPSAKFKMIPNFDKPLTPLNSCKKNLEFKEAITQLQLGFKKLYKQNMKLIIDLPEQYTQTYMGVDFSHIFHLVETDILQFLMKFEFEPMRNQTLDCKLSIERQFILNKNSIIELRRLIFMKNFNRLRIRIRDSSAGIKFVNNEIVICIDVTNITSLPSSTQYLSMIVESILKKEKTALPKEIIFQQTEKHESTEVLLKELDLINCIPYQTEQIEESIKLIDLIYKKKFDGFKIILHRKKTQIKFDSQIQIYFNIQTSQRQFFSSEEIIRHYVAFFNKKFEPNIKALTYFDVINEKIIVQQCQPAQIKIVFKNLQSSWVLQDVRNIQQYFTSIKSKCLIPSKYFIIESDNIYSNFFFKVDSQLALKNQNQDLIRCKSKHLYLQSPKAIHLNFNNISIQQTDSLFKQNTNKFNLLQSPLEKNTIIIRLLSKDIYFITINYEQSMVLNINYGGNVNIFNKGLTESKVVVSSDGNLCLDNTKFIELEIYKRKPVLIKDKQNENKNSQFRQLNQKASNQELEMKLGDFSNIENLVYVVNDQCKKYLTRAGEPRVDFIQLCDNDGNPIDCKEKIEAVFVHINRLAIVRPDIIKRNLQLGLNWTPTIRGHYYLYINNVRINPPYEIGVCAAQADYKNTIVTLPKIKKICYCEQSELMLDLRDSFGNLYTQLEEDILGDSLLIELKCSKMNEFLKLQKFQINKYGLKKLKFNFSNTDEQKETEIQIQVYLNCEFVAHFQLVMDGLSLKQRKKMLDKDIDLNSKHYYKDITVNRNKFLQELFVIAQKSLHTNLTVRFLHEPGIDAGGVKREFYDMIGNEIKNQQNPFFKLINPNTMEYFLNPEILRNKKKLEYMELFGKYLANSFLNSYLIGVLFSPVFIKLLYEQTIDYEDLLSVLPTEERKQYEYLLKATPEQLEDLDLYFTAMVDKKKCVEIELKEGGKDIQVTASNVKQYLQCTAQILITERYKEIMTAFRKGFETVLELSIFKKWIRYSEFWCLTAGNKQITPELVLNYIVFQGYGVDNISGWFRRFISQATHEVLLGFLKFSSGSSSIDFSLASKVTVTFQNAGDNPKKLPISHTCWKEIVVPKYKTYEIMKKLLTAAFIYCSEGFGFG